MTYNSLSKQERLCGRNNINQLFTTPQSGFCYPFRWVMLDDAAKELCVEEGVEVGVSVLFSVPKKNIRRANKRNLLKRRMREAYRTNKHPLTDTVVESGVKMSLGLLYVAKEPLEYGVIESSIKKIIATVGKCRAVNPDSTIAGADMDLS